MCRLIPLSLIGLMSLTGAADAQYLPAPAPNPNYSRAYRYFLNSPHTYKEFSSSQPGVFSETITPLSRRTFSVEPSYYRERVTPYSFETHEYVPGYSGSLTTPFFGSGYGVPGYSRSYVQPLPPDPRRFSMPLRR